MLSDTQIDIINSYGCIVIKTGCSPFDAKDKFLPTSSYLLTLEKSNGETWHDIVMGMKSDIFDAYYDMFGNVLKKMEWTDGNRNPKLWSANNKKKK